CGAAGNARKACRPAGARLARGSCRRRKGSRAASSARRGCGRRPTADINSKGGGFRQCGLQRVLPATARTEVSLVDPDLEAVGLGLLALLKPLGEAQGSFAVDAGMGEEQRVLAVWDH